MSKGVRGTGTRHIFREGGEKKVGLLVLKRGKKRHERFRRGKEFKKNFQLFAKKAADSVGEKRGRDHLEDYY